MTRNSRGFSLIELLVVVALIAIVAAVAGPQLTAYTVQGANAQAAADLRNAAAAEKAFFADWGVYASSSWGGIPGNGQAWNSFFSQTGLIPATVINGKAPRVAIPEPGFQVTLSGYVGLVINTSAGGGSFTMVAKHTSGDRCFGMDADTKEVYWVNAGPGLAVTSSSAPPAVAVSDDFSGVYGTASCSGIPWGQYVWTAL